FEDGKAAVPFVQVQDAGGDAHGAERAISANAEQRFLADADAAIAAVQTRSKFAIFLGVAFHVGIEKKQIDAAYADTPDFGADDAATGFNLHADGFAVGADGGLHGELIDVGMEVLFVLPALAVEALGEVALAIEQAHADQGNAEVGRAFDMVTGQHAEAARVDGQRFMQAEFSGEIPNRARTQDPGMDGAPGNVGFQILALTTPRVINAAVQHELTRAPFDLRQRHFAKQRDRVVVELAEASRVKFAEQAGGIGIPAPGKVAGQRPEFFL